MKRTKKPDSNSPPRSRVAQTSQLSDDEVLAALQAAGQPMPFEELVTQLGTKPTGLHQLSAQLESLIHAGKLLRNRRGQYCLREKLGLTVGIVSGHKDGYGFVQPIDRTQAPLYLAHRQMQQVMHGDRVTARVTGTDHRGRSEGVIVEVLERGTLEIVGRLYSESGIYFVVPDNPRISHRVLVPRENVGDAKPGQVVLLKVAEQPSRTAQPVGHVTRVLGEHAAPGMETEIAIHSHGLPFEFPDAVIAEAGVFGHAVNPAAKRSREDLREMLLVTIDGEDARDFDDAVWCEPSGSGWRLIVAIADVGHYVDPGSQLDQEALNRGTSVYFPNRVIPMLPEALSNGLCSINPGVDRLCMACEMHVADTGKVSRARFFEGIMRSAARLTYTEVAAFLAQSGQTAKPFPKGEELGQPLKNLYAVFHALFKARQERGALDFDAPEIKARFDQNGRIATFVEQSRNDAHRLIEECMIAANVQAARFLKKHKIPTLYRVHGQPEEERLEQLREFLKGFAIELPTGRPLTPLDLSAVLAQAAGKEEGRLIETVVVRSLPQAVYQPANIGHFGLSLTEYAHFTSPIRRYPDLVVHRGIRHVLRGGTADDLPAALSAMETLGQQCSFKERRADDATRDAMSWLKCEYMQDKIGEEFDSIVTGVVDFGLFVQVAGVHIDGLIHVSALGSDYFTRDKSGYRLVGERSKRVFRLGDHLRVRLINVIIDERKIDFELAERPKAAASGQSNERRPGGRPQRRGPKRS